MATREGRRCKDDPCAVGAVRGRLAPFLSVLCNNIQIYGSDTEGTNPTFIARTLVEDGAVAYLKSENLWSAFTSTGRRRYDHFPTVVRLIGADGVVSSDIKTGEGKDADLCIIPANAFFYPPRIAIKRKVDTLDEIASALGQNMDALRQATAVIYDDPDLKAQIDAANKERLRGGSTVSIRKKLGQDLRIENFSPSAESHLPDLLDFWTNTIEELDESTGRVKVGEKSERRTDDEITVIENSASAEIDVIIDTFNRFCKWYGISARAERGVEVKSTPSEQPEREEQVMEETAKNE